MGVNLGVGQNHLVQIECLDDEESSNVPHGRDVTGSVGERVDGDGIELDSKEGPFENSNFLDGNYGLSNDDDLYKLHGLDGSSNEEGSKGKGKFLEFRVGTDMKDIAFRLRMMFSLAKEFKEVARKYTIAKGKPIRFVKEETTRVRAIYKEGFNWIIFASMMQG
ncbi:hypothetical protein F0562_001210 [Nyssa sinensis]|uniref:Transposase MuDR plant domain-containing protein n=1 Tax=Nyssa sinensis TaxID=561372 RepID=A0A5J5C719_9ASTE|nr:hypothetical protein F0562_001210 [Nyssa sinensis]